MSVQQDVQNIREGTHEIVNDVQEFLKNHQGKSPQEVLGSMAQSSLIQAIFLATFLAAGILVLGSVGPYFYQEMIAQTPTEEAETPNPAAAEEDSKQEPAESKKASTNTPEANPDVSDEDKQKVVKQLGLEETKFASPDENPLENSADDLLNELK